MPPSSSAAMETAMETASSAKIMPFSAGHQHGGVLGGLFQKNNYEREFLPAVVEILETPASPLGRTFLLAISAFAGLALLWACLGEVDIVAVAQGKIVPSGRTKVLQPLEAGIVTRIAVEEGQRVAKGDLLIELDSTATEADFDKAAKELTRQYLTAARLRSVLGLNDGATLDDLMAEQPDDLSTAELALAVSLRASQVAEHEAKLDALYRELDRAKASASAAETDLKRVRAQMPLQQEQMEARRSLLEKGLTSRLQFLELQQETIALEGEAAAAESRINETQAAIGSIERQISQVEQEFRRDRLKELNEADAAIAQLTEERKKAEQRNTQQYLVAPVDGTVQQLQVHTVGGVVTPAQNLLAIVPDDAGIEIEALVENQDIGFVMEGQEAVVKLEAFPFTRYGTIAGHVQTVSEDAVEQPAEGMQPAKLAYTSRVRLEKDTISIEGKQVRLSPGMVATVEIKTGERKIIEFVLSPLMKLGDEAARER
jgi:hemolysin D